ncbi:hypothetical protein [Streptomyces sp. NPDC054874]
MRSPCRPRTRLHQGRLDLWGEREPCVDDDGFLDWRVPEADAEAVWDVEELNRRHGFG